jgi:hypothetical protein
MYSINDSLFCPGDTAIIYVMRDSQELISWNGVTGDSTFRFIGTDTVVLTIEDTVTTCSNSESVSVVFNQQPELNYITPDSTGLCTGDTTNITFERLDTIYLEGAMITSDTSFRVTAGSYPVEGFLDGCLTRDTLIIEEWALPELNLRDSFYFCEGASVVLFPEEEEDSTQTYRWNGVDSSYALEAERSGIYYLEAFSAFGCRAEVQTNVFSVPLPDSLSIAYSYTEGDSIYGVFLESDLDSFNGFLNWHVPGLVLEESNDSLSVWWGSAPADTVTVCAQYLTEQPIACETDSFCIQVPTALILSSVHEGKDSFIEVYPNPFDQQLRVELSRNKKLRKLELWNASGQLAWQLDDLPISGSEIRIPTDHLSNGFYLLRAETELGTETYPLLKTR